MMPTLDPGGTHSWPWWGPRKGTYGDTWKTSPLIMREEFKLLFRTFIRILLPYLIFYEVLLEYGT